MLSPSSFTLNSPMPCQNWSVYKTATLPDALPCTDFVGGVLALGRFKGTGVWALTVSEIVKQIVAAIIRTFILLSSHNFSRELILMSIEREIFLLLQGKNHRTTSRARKMI